MKRKVTFLALAALAGCLPACTEFIEEPLDGQQVELLSPGHGAQTTDYLLTFLWEPVEHALAYRLQVASPGFNDAAFFLADTTLESTRFNVTLPPGRYEWRVRALNGSSRTAYVTQAFSVHEGALSRQQVLLQSPADHHITSADRITFSWSSLFGVMGYRLQLGSQPFAEEAPKAEEWETDDLSFTHAPEAEGIYYWRVRAESDTAQSRWSAGREFTIDRTPPEAPALQSPANQQQVSRPVALAWSAPEGAVSYRLYVYKTDSVTLYSARFPLTLPAPSHSLQEGQTGERLVWRVTATDAAGNASSYSPFRSFTILP